MNHLEIKFEIPEDKIKDFSCNAKSKIIDYAKSCTLDVINEAERIELSGHEEGSPNEITASHVGQATNRLRSMRGVKKHKSGITVLKIVSEILILITGIMFLPEQFITENNSLNIVYFIIFIVILASALITTITSHFIGGE